MWKINLFTGVFLFLLGFLIIKFKMTYLIAGYNTSTKKQKAKYDKDKLVKYVGGLLIISSFILLLSSLISLAFYNFEKTIFFISNIIFTLFILSGVIYINISGVVKKGD